METNKELPQDQIRCFVDDNEVPLKECDLEHQSRTAEDFASDCPNEPNEKDNIMHVPEGSSIVNIIVRNGLVIEKVYQTLEGERVIIKEEKD